MFVEKEKEEKCIPACECHRVFLGRHLSSLNRPYPFFEYAFLKHEKEIYDTKLWEEVREGERLRQCVWGAGEIYSRVFLVLF